VKTEQQIKRLRATANALMALKKNPELAPLLKGLPILGTVRRAERDLFAVQQGILPDEEFSLVLQSVADSLDELLRATEKHIGA
jgi:hypothetical protein